MFKVGDQGLYTFYVHRAVSTQSFHKGKGAPTRYAGVEIECDGFDNIRKPDPDWYPKFSYAARDLAEDFPILSDIRRTVVAWGGGIYQDRDFEIQTAPASGDKFQEQIKQITGLLRAGGARQGKGCGLHVHVDCRDLGPKQLRRVILAYGHLENTIIRAVPQHRARNKYCKPLGDYALHRLEKIKNNEDNVRAKVFEKTHDDRRYLALNPSAYEKHGTLEIRLHEATVDAKEIIAWTTFWSEFISQAAVTDARKIVKLDDRIGNVGLFVSEDSLAYLKRRIRRFSKDVIENGGIKDLEKYAFACGEAMKEGYENDEDVLEFYDEDE